MATKHTSRFLVMSDTHDLDFKHLHKVPAADVILHCGDITEEGGLEGYEKLIDYLSTIPTELKLVIAGNHDTTLDPNLQLDEHTTALALFKNEKCRRNNIHYLEEGIHRFTLSSGSSFTIYASPYTPEYGISAFQYPTKNDRYNAHSATTPDWAECNGTAASMIPDDAQIDIMMTHGPPKYILDGTRDKNSGGCEHLRRAVARVRPQMHCFGHVHEAWGYQRVYWRGQLSKEKAEELDDDYRGRRTKDVDDDDAIMLPKGFVARNSVKKRGYATTPADEGLGAGKETLFINAAIENMDGQPQNTPWLVELALDAPVPTSRGTKRKR